MTTPSLEYAPRPPLPRRRIFRRIALAAALIFTVASGWWWGPPVWWKVQLLYWQHKCLTFVQPPGQVVFDSVSAKSVVPPVWQKFYSMYSPPGMQSSGTIFLGELKSPTGNRRLVAIDAVQSGNFFGPNISTYCRVFREDIWLHLVPASEKETVVLGYPTSFSSLSTLTVYSGRIDPTDGSHMTFTTQENNLRHEFNAWLQDNDSVVIGADKIENADQ